MKTIRKILPTLLSLALLFANQISESQTQICSGDSLRLRLDSFRGNIQWQESADSLIWSDISGASYQPYIVIPNTTKFFRAVVTDGNCDPIYSPVQKVMVTTRQAPTAAVHISTLNAIIWKWNAVAGANGYKWNTVDDYGSSENLGTDTFRIESNLNCDSTYIRYVWAYNDCGNSVSSTLTQSTALCPANNCGVINDSRDGQSYQTVVIGAQCWMAENLRFLPSVHTNTDFEVQGNNSQPAYGVYGYNGSSLDTAQGKASYAIYGALYNWWAATQGEGDCNGSGAPPNDDCTVPVQGICPTGWHLPSHYEWTTLERAVCSINCTTNFPYDESTGGFRGTDEGAKLAAFELLWVNDVLDSNLHFGESGFLGLPGSCRNGNGTFSLILPGHQAVWWSTSGDGTYGNWVHIISSNASNIGRSSYSKKFGLSVRCIKD